MWYDQILLDLHPVGSVQDHMKISRGIDDRTQPWVAPPLPAIILGSNEALKTRKCHVCVWERDCYTPNDESPSAAERISSNPGCSLHSVLNHTFKPEVSP